jgi:hypothetical protein
MFEEPADYAAFLNVVADAVHECPKLILAFVLIPNHWHFILWPKDDGDLSAFWRSRLAQEDGGPPSLGSHFETARPTQ